MGLTTRRSFLRKSMGLGLSLGLGSHTPVWGANETIRVGIVGLRVKGAQHVNAFRTLPGVKVAALCDVDQSILDREVAAFAKRGEKVRGLRDVRHLLDDKDIDAVVVATPNHWHALISVWACQAGKDVYLEKPVSHNILEGERVVQAAGKYRRIVQTGSQLRSDRGLQAAVDFIRSGQLGQIRWARAIFYHRRKAIGKVNGPQPVPPSVDYNLWTGPAPLEPLQRKQLHGDWHWFWSTGNGDTGNFGTHYVDVCRWFLGQNRWPRQILSIGARFGYDDDGQTPNTQISFFDYEPAPILFEVRGLPRRQNDPVMDAYRGVRWGVTIQCEHGYFAGGWAYDNNGKRIKQFERTGGQDHQANFIQAMRSRRTTDLTADVAEGRLSADLCHAANISHRLGQTASPTDIHNNIRSDADLAETFDRMEAHLRANGINPATTPAVLGSRLTIDPQQGRFTGPSAEAANRFLSRDYRPPFVLPEVL